MKIRNLVLPAVAAILAAAPPLAQSATISGWAIHNGTSTVAGAPSAPTFTAADNITAMAPFDQPVTLDSNGDFVEVSTTVTITGRTGGVGVNTLNTQLRVGLFNGPAGAVAASDIPNQGFIIEYSNLAAGGLIREQPSASQTNPFNSPTNLGNGTPDAGGDSIQGANPGPVTLTLKLTRNAGMLDLFGTISGTDSVSGNAYLSNFTLNGISTANFPANGTFNFNRIGLFLGDGVNGASAALSNSTVQTNVPEPAAGLLAVTAVAVAIATAHGRRPVAQFHCAQR
jgi:hypothetical protein